jgi:ribosomal protein S18 acetylase RimI-like enzyme
MEAPAPIVVERLTPATREDYLAFFDHERGPAFSDNAEWARCYCQFYRVPRALDWKAFTAEQNRVAAGASIACGEAEGYLAKAGGETVGWLHAAPRHKLPHAFERLRVEPTDIDVPSHDAAVIVCFVVAPAWRRRGVATALLDAALADLAARGIAIVDAFPFKAGDSTSSTDHYHGPAALFASRGFEPIGGNDEMTVVRRRLAPGAQPPGA